MSNAGQSGRVDWVDYAKGICIVMVVTMHSTLGVEAAAGAEGWMHALVEFAKPFRMPDFFLISGLFLARTIDRDWTRYLDRKVVHFLYFYALWVTIQFAFKAPGLAAEMGPLGVLKFYLFSYIEPFGTLWFIYLLPVFFVVTKLARRVPPVLIFAVGAVLEALPIETGWIMIDEFAARFVYFFAGYWLASRFFAFARGVQARPLAAVAAIGGWAVINGLLVAAGYAALPGISLILGFAGASAVIAIAALLARANAADLLRHAGEHSIAVYLAFFLPMAVTRTVLLKTGIVTDIGTIALIVTTAGAIAPLVLHWLVSGTRFDFLFRRPAFFHIDRPRRAALQPAE
ncbi:MAG: acyltransferase family protein [Bradyrhizobiaceae bacterium]|nr:acyltransferase family protein [Bradyrhizobiaceae bacterium]